MTELEQFIERYRRLALWAARRRVTRSGGALDPHDVGSDALLGLWRAARTYDPTRGRSEPSWALYCVEHDITDGIRTRLGRGRPRHPPTLPLEDSTATTAPPDSDVATHVDLARAIAHLTPRQRSAIRGYYWHGYTLAELGHAFDITESATSLLLRRARARVREELTNPTRATPPPRPKPRPPAVVTAPPPTRDTHCWHCGAPFTARRAGARYCSNAHRQAAHRARTALANDHGPHSRFVRGWGPSVRSGSRIACCPSERGYVRRAPR